MNISLRIGIAILAILCLAGLLWWYLQPTSSIPASIQAAKESVLSGQPDQAIAEANSYLSDDPDGEYAVMARGIIAHETINNAATSNADRASMIELRKKDFRDAPSPYMRAIATNQIARMLFDNDPDPTLLTAMYESVFKESEFQALQVEDRGTSLTNLIRYSIRTYPTAEAYLLLARQDANWLQVDIAKFGSNKVSASNAAEREKRATRIVKNIAKADALFASDISNGQNSPYAILIEPALYYWRGYALDAAARVNIANLPELERSFDKVSQLADAAGATADALSSLQRLEAYAEFKHASALSFLAGATRAGDIRTHLSKFVALLKANPERFPTFYSSLKSFGSASSKRGLETRAQYEKLASFSPEFTAFLKELGWNLK